MAEFTPDKATHLHVVDSPGLLQSHLLAPADATHPVISDSTITWIAQAASPVDTLHGHSLDTTEFRAIAMPAVLEWPWLDVAPASTWTLEGTLPRRQIYVAILRADGFDDLEVPMSSMQLRRRDGNPTMISIVIPDTMTYLDGAQDRVGGEIIIYAGSVTLDGVRHLSLLERVSLETVAYDHGVNSSSLTLGGYRTVSNDNPRPVDLTGIRYYGMQADGKMRVRGVVDIFLRPGDTAIFGLLQIVVEQIYIKVEASNSWMEVAGT